MKMEWSMGLLGAPELCLLMANPSPHTDIPEIPESIKFCKALEIADFSGNPLSRYVSPHSGGWLLTSGSSRWWASEAWYFVSPGFQMASHSCAAWLTWP